ncbi:putative HTH-type transcriptional regulator YddM [bacterium BMS3Abin04]|nr:putative HTH-type transcriptional regulator YddM [bacterium BMS3Abin04]
MKMHNPEHPGEILKELYIKPLNITITEAAKALGVTRNTLSELINGHSGISTEMALRLSKTFNTTPELWLNMQQNFNLSKARKKVRLSRVKVLV